MTCSKCKRSTKVSIWIVPTVLEATISGKGIRQIPTCKVHLDQIQKEENIHVD